MRFIRGKTLSEAVRDFHARREADSHRRVDLLALVQAFVGVCNTVAFAHSKGVIHRDLKGQNIVLGEFGEVILLDWGLAKLVEGTSESDAHAPKPLDLRPEPPGDESSLTIAGQVMGTPAFMAPEQAAGRLDRIGRHTDIYGLGAILYEILAGRAPFEGGTTREVLRKVVEEAPAEPRQSWPKVPRALEALCLKAMAKDADARYDSAAQLAAEVQHWLAGEPVAAYREPWSARAQRWVARHRTLVTSAAAALVVAVAGLTALILTQARANADLQAALLREENARLAATERFGFAREAIKAFYSGITEDVMLRRPELDTLRQGLLEKALTFFDKFAAMADLGRVGADMSPAVLDVPRALTRVAAIQALLGDRDRAIQAQGRAIALFDRIPEHREAARAALDLGNLLRSAGRPDEAITAMRDAVSRHERISREGLNQGQLARAFADLGRLLADSGELDEGRRLLEKARKIEELPLREDPSQLGSGNLAALLTTLGNLCDAEGRREEARECYEMARRIYEARRAKYPAALHSTSSYRWELAEEARALNNLGLAQTRAGASDEGFGNLDRARAIREKFLADQPLNIDYRSDLARSFFHLALAKQATGSRAEALQDIAKAEELYDGIPPKGPEDAYFQGCLKAMRAELIGGGKPDAELSAVERDERLREAIAGIQRLEQAVAMGYRNPALYRNDPALAALRPLPEFEDLVRSLRPSSAAGDAGP